MYDYNSSIEPSSGIIHKPMAKVLLVAASLASTGAVSQEANIISTLDNTSIIPAPHLEKKNFKETSSYKEQIIAIKSALSVNISTLATILKVSRPTIYSWVNNEQVPNRQELVKRIQVVSTLVEELEQQYPESFPLSKKDPKLALLTTYLEEDVLNIKKIKMLMEAKTSPTSTSTKPQSLAEIAKAKGMKKIGYKLV